MMQLSGAPGADPAGLAEHMAGLGFAVVVAPRPAPAADPVVVDVQIVGAPWWRRRWGEYLITRWAYAAGWRVRRLTRRGGGR